MGDKEKLISDESVEATRNVAKKDNYLKLPWYFAGGFLVFWALLFFAIVIPLFYKLPTPLTMEDAKKSVFITERAFNNLYTIANIGNKLTGSTENEVQAVDFIVNELESIQSVLLTDYFTLEYKTEQVSGGFAYSTMLNTYQGVQNVVARLSPINGTTDDALLINSHFDSKPYTNSAGDAGFMIVAMLEVLRVIATTKQSIDHPLIFLFNGAEEGALEASHGFILNDPWAKSCRAVINLDAAGSGGKDILFQSGPNHPWLIKYYKQCIKYPFATTMAEEIFQSGIIPSDTDFRQFTTYGDIPGLDMAQVINGYVYHTKYDLIDVIPRGALQNTGDNILSLVRCFANATEIYDTAAYASGHAVFFDFLGVYFFYYSESTGIYLNYGVAGATLILIFVSIWRMSSVSKVSICHVIRWFILVFVIQIISFVLGLGLPIAVAYGMYSLGLSLTYYSTHLLVVGLYVCPSLIGLSVPITIYYSLQRNDKLSNPYHLQLALHSQAILLAVLAAVVTYLGYRTAYIFTIPLIFYVGSLALNLLTTLHDRGYSWSGLLKLSQVVPFLYSSYLMYVFIVALTPMGGRAGSGSNRDLYIAVLAALGTILSFGFLVPLINSFRRPSFVILGVLATTALAFYLASSTQLGFPYRPKTSGQRVSYLQVRNMFYEYDGTLSKDESGYLFSFQDSRGATPFAGTKVNLTGLVSIADRCDTHMMCGMPLYDYRFYANRPYLKWLPRSEPIVPPGDFQFELLNKTSVNSTTMRYWFEASVSSHMNIFLKANEDVEITGWSFLESYLTNTPPYFIYLVHGIDDSPYIFSVDIWKSDGDFDVPAFQLGCSDHRVQDPGDAEAVKFASTFPSFSILAQWPVLYKRYIF
ncbi:endoplasmic reticulum metallopeptidase 1-like isoform X2 [Drosophila albomicans]|uniref:FXNA-like protease n=1 Tax=Drosophila albomicans TaxID=7291 RepID=A0A9C6SX99_DROAB|nr:endoplasmic reticulum metallopeptidase 1-like isoform X2 [Drosophila albomicans]